jgi:hypothetical protein
MKIPKNPWTRKQYPFRKGNRTINLVEIERVVFLGLIKLAKPKNDIERRILRRLILKALGHPAHNYPIYPPKECPVCERSFAAKIYDRHVLKCEAEEKEMRTRPKIDPEVYERLAYES